MSLTRYDDVCTLELRPLPCVVPLRCGSSRIEPFGPQSDFPSFPYRTQVAFGCDVVISGQNRERPIRSVGVVRLIRPDVSWLGRGHLSVWQTCVFG